MPRVRKNWRISAELGTMSRYLTDVGRMLDNERNEVEDFYEAASKQFPEHERDEFLASNYGVISEVAEDYPRLLFSSFVMSWYSFVEDSLFQGCKEFDLSVTITANDRDDFDKGIFRARQ